MVGTQVLGALPRPFPTLPLLIRDPPTHPHAHTNTCIHTWMCTHAHAHAHTCTHNTHKHMHMHMHTHAHTHTCAHTNTCKHACTHVHTETHTHTQTRARTHTCRDPGGEGEGQAGPGKSTCGTLAPQSSPLFSPPSPRLSQREVTAPNPATRGPPSSCPPVTACSPHGLLFLASEAWPCGSSASNAPFKAPLSPATSYPGFRAHLKCHCL